MSTFGRHHHRRDIELEGVTLYGQAVAKVRGSLAADPSPVLTDLLVPVLILLLYSSSQPETGESQAHVMGLFRLITLSGPKSFQRRPLRDAYNSCRATLVTVGLLQKRRSFLEEPGWCTVPWALEPQAKTDQDKLVDLLAQVPGLAETQQALRESFDCQRQHKMINTVLIHVSRLLQWRCKWEVGHPHAAAEVNREHTPSTAFLPSQTHHFLRFSCFSTAVEIALYNAVLIYYLGLIYSEMTAIQARTVVQQLATSEDSESNVWLNRALIHPAHCPVTLEGAAVEIVRSFEYQLVHAQHCPDTPALFWLLPLGLALGILEEDDVMSQWIRTMLDTSIVIRGYGRGKNAFGFGSYQLPKVDKRIGGYYGQVHIS